MVLKNDIGVGTVSFESDQHLVRMLPFGVPGEPMGAGASLLQKGERRPAGEAPTWWLQHAAAALQNACWPIWCSGGASHEKHLLIGGFFIFSSSLAEPLT